MDPEGKTDIARRNKRLAMIHVGISLAILAASDARLGLRGWSILAAFVIKQSLA